MGRPGFYQRDRLEIARATSRLDQIGRELAAAFERWESLEALA